MDLFGDALDIFIECDFLLKVLRVFSDRIGLHSRGS